MCVACFSMRCCADAVGLTEAEEDEASSRLLPCRGCRSRATAVLVVAASKASSKDVVEQPGFHLQSARQAVLAIFHTFLSASSS